MKFPILKLCIMGVILWQIGLSSLFAREWGTMPWPVADGEAVVYNDKIYLFGGYSDSLKASVDWIQEFDPFAEEGQQWRIVGHMKIARSHFLAKLYKDKVYIFGGEMKPESKSIWAMETWSFTEDQSLLHEENREINRIGAAGVVWNQYLVMLGGYIGKESSNAPNFIIVYDLNAGKIVHSFSGGLGQFMYDQVAALINNRIFVFGGVRRGVSNRIYEIVIELDSPRPRLQEIRVRPDLLSSRAGFEAIVGNNIAYLIGGYDESEKPMNAIDSFLVTKDGFELSKSTSSLKYPRKSLMAASLKNSVYVFGGFDENNDVVAQIEIFPAPNVSSRVEDRITVNEYRLAQNYPNPFNSKTRIEFELPYAEYISLEIFSATGQKIRTLAAGMYLKGRHQVEWDGRDAAGNPLPSGVYFYKLTSSAFIETKKMLLVQ